MTASNSKLRSSSSFPNFLLSSLNLLLFLLSSASLIPIFLLRTPPTSFGWGLVAVSAATILASLTGFCSQLAHLCFVAHTSLALTAILGQALGFLALFLRPGNSTALLGSTLDRREAWVLVRLEAAGLLGMFAMQSAALVVACAVERWWVREYEGMEAEQAEVVRKRSRRMARVQEESLANAAVAAEARARELDEKMKSKYGKWVKNEVEG